MLSRSAAGVVLHTRSVHNHLLHALGDSEGECVLQRFELVRLAQGDVLYEPDQPISHVYFLETAVVSLVSSLNDALSVEVATVGCEGMVGLPVFLGGDATSTRAIVQIPGSAQCLDAVSFNRLASTPGAFHDLMLRYSHAFLIQVAQTAACNGVHLVRERCARWLLMTHDRVHGNRFPLTHDFLAFMLGVRRAGVSVAMHALQESGLINYGRGSVQILDRERLEEASCECYRVVQAHFDRLLG
jgi:CRP-like cAMP-binding protein